MPWLLSKVTGKLCEQLSEGYFLGLNLWLDQTSISSCMEGEGERKQREKGGRKNTEEGNRNNRKETDLICFPESVLWGIEGEKLSARQLPAVPRELWPCQSPAAAAVWTLQLDRGRGWASSTPRRSSLRPAPPTSFGGFGFPLHSSSENLTRKLSRSRNLLLLCCGHLRRNKIIQSEGTWAPFQFYIFRRKDEPLTPKKVLREKLSVLTSPWWK